VVDIQGEITTLLNTLPGINAWRNRLPVGFKNTSAAVVVKVDADQLHQSGATRTAYLQCRIYGGSEHLVDCRNVYDSVVGVLNNYNSRTISSIGAIRGQELPPEPLSGWPGYIARFEVTVKER
jgi:hypothetical protein